MGNRIILILLCFSFLIAESGTTNESDKSSILSHADQLVQEGKYIEALIILNQPQIISNLQISPENQLWLEELRVDSTLIDYYVDVEDPFMLAAIYARIGIAEKKSEYLSVSESLINESLEIDPENSEAFYYLAVIYSQRADLTKSLYYLEKAFEVDYIDHTLFMEDNALENIQKTSEFSLLVDKYFTEDDILANEYRNIARQFFSDGDYNNTVQYLSKAAKLWKTSDKYRLLADIHILISLSYKELGKNKKFFKEMQKVLEYFEKDGDKERVAEQYSYLGLYFLTLNYDYKKSIKNYNTSLELYQELQDTAKIAKQFSGMALTTKIQGYKTDSNKYLLESIDYSQTALEIYGLINDSLHYAKESEEIGNIYRLSLSNYNKAIEYLAAAHELYSILGLEDKTNEVANDLAWALQKQGEIYSDEGKYSDCVEHLEYSLEYNQNLEDLETRAWILVELSVCYMRTGAMDKSLLLDKEITEIAESINNYELLIFSPIMKAIPLAMAGRVEEAIELVDNGMNNLKSYPDKDKDPEDFQKGMYGLNGIAAFIVMTSTKNIQAAMPYMRECFSTAEKYHLKDALYYYLKALYYMYGEPDMTKSLQYMEKSVKDPSLKGQWIGMSVLFTNELGIMYYMNGMFDKARELLMEAYSFSKNNKDFSGISNSLVYLSIINMLDMINNDNEELAERTEQNLSELITLLDANYPLEYKYSKEFFDQYLVFYELYAMVLELNGKGIQSLEILDDVKSRILRSQLQAIESSETIDESHPISILDTDIIISLDIINNASHSFYQYNVPKQTESYISKNAGIEFSDDGFDILVQSFYTSDDSVFWHYKNKDDEIFSESMPNLDVIVKIYRSYLLNKDPRTKGLAKLLYKYLFTSNVHTYQIKNKKHLIIMPDPILSYLPFGTLIDEEGKYLIETYDISYIQSFDILSILQSREYDIDSNMLFAYGGIEYNKPEDSKLNENISMLELEKIVSSKIETRGSLTDIYSHMGYIEIPYLPFALSEVQEIGKYFSTAEIITGRAASENKLKEMSKSGKLAEYNVLHFSTHGFIVPEIPELSALVLATDDNDLEDGYLNASEIMNLDLKADFVNLSACETGMGKIYKGEGVVGLTQAFMIAGANAMSVTLWPVADESTSIFMTEMYKTAEEMDISYLESMSIVKRKFISGDFGKKYQDPYYWAPFVYYGK